MCVNFGIKNMGIDLGTANTLIYLKNGGIILNEPSVIAVESRGSKIIAVGHEAKAMLGKAPKAISVIRPLRDGVISDFDRTADMLSEFLGQALKSRRIRNFRVVIGVPSGVTEVERRAVEEVVLGMGAKEVYILEEPMAAAIGARMPIDGNVGCMIADIGGGTTDIAIIALGGVVCSTSIRHAGDKMNDAIIAYMRKKFSLYIGEQTAEKIKMEIGCAMIDKDENGNDIIETIEISSRDSITGLPKTVTVDSRDMVEALEESVDIIIEGIKKTIEDAPAEIAPDIVKNGMVLFGGGGLIKNLGKLITIKSGINVYVADNAFEAVAIGAGISLEDMDKLKVYSQSGRKNYR